MKKLLLSLSVVVATAVTGFADAFSHTQTASGGYSATVTVPSAAMCYQYEAAYSGGNVYNAGPLGSYYRTASDPSFSIQGSIPAGVYTIQQTVAIAGYSGTAISW